MKPQMHKQRRTATEEPHSTRGMGEVVVVVRGEGGGFKQFYSHEFEALNYKYMFGSYRDPSSHLWNSTVKHIYM